MPAKALRKRSQPKTTMGRLGLDEADVRRFMAIKKAQKSAPKKAAAVKKKTAKKTAVAKKFKGVRREKGTR